MSNEKNELTNEEQMETNENALDTRMQDPGFWKEIWEQIRLVWLLMRDNEVPVYLKLLPLAAVIYVIIPTDLIPDFFIPFGGLDDITAVLVGAKMFIEMAPQNIVARHIQNMRRVDAGLDLDGVEQSDKELDASIVIEGEFERKE